MFVLREAIHESYTNHRDSSPGDSNGVSQGGAGNIDIRKKINTIDFLYHHRVFLQKISMSSPLDVRIDFNVE